MAIPISARVSAGASLIPSPTMMTFPFSCNARTSASLPSGRTPAMTSSTPAAFPIAFAVRSLSPVSMTTFMPRDLSSRMAFGLSSLITSATAMIPKSFPSAAKKTQVFPSSERTSAFAVTPSGTSAAWRMNERLPPETLSVPREASSPLPGSALKSVTSSALIPCSSAFRKIAFASGCSLFLSSDNASPNRSSSEKPSAGKISVT